jgi:hypothetical protein
LLLTSVQHSLPADAVLGFFTRMEKNLYVQYKNQALAGEKFLLV